MPLSVVQGDQRGEAAAEEGSLPAKRASRSSPVSAALWVCRETSSTLVNRCFFCRGVEFWVSGDVTRTSRVTLLTLLNGVQGWFL